MINRNIEILILTLDLNETLFFIAEGRNGEQQSYYNFRFQIND